MTKYEVLCAFEASWGFVSPDQVRARINPHPDRRSMYSYLLRLAQQGLLDRTGRRGTLAYRLTERGLARLRYFERQQHH
jgi:hypothetical protein